MVKITKLPPQEQHVFFQEHQFDADLGGQDPIRYANNRWPKDRRIKDTPSSSAAGQRTKRKRMKKAEEALAGHENKEAILKILRSE
jgi:hypothetical protein